MPISVDIVPEISPMFITLLSISYTDCIQNYSIKPQSNTSMKMVLAALHLTV